MVENGPNGVGHVVSLNNPEIPVRLSSGACVILERICDGEGCLHINGVRERLRTVADEAGLPERVVMRVWRREIAPIFNQ